MEHRSWPRASARKRYAPPVRERREKKEEEEEEVSEVAALPLDVVRRIAARLRGGDLRSLSLVCRAWNEALAPLREAMVMVRWGKRFKHGTGGVTQNRDKALHSFLHAARKGSSAAMVDAGLLLWEMGKKEQGIELYRAAADLGDPAGQCNLGLSYLQVGPSHSQEAVKWFYRAAFAGHVRAQYSLALCLQQGRGVECNPMKAANNLKPELISLKKKLNTPPLGAGSSRKERSKESLLSCPGLKNPAKDFYKARLCQAKWYLRAAEGGSTRAMYNTALCYLSGEGIVRNYQEARKWMKRAALAGHKKAQFEHGLTLFAEGDGGCALVFLELATRAGETAATHIRDILLQQLSPKSRAHAITCADNWQIKQSSR